MYNKWECYRKKVEIKSNSTMFTHLNLRCVSLKCSHSKVNKDQTLATGDFLEVLLLPGGSI